MNIDKEVLDAINDIGFREPTKIQSEAIPLIKEGYDVVGQSETGSGKTGAFGIPLVEKVSKGEGVQALILVPTRELAQQIALELQKFSRRKGLRVQCVYGGAPIAPQISGLRHAEIVVGTPGRIMDHLERGTLRTDRVGIFVLDEADKMIDMGFIDDIKLIEREIPRERQTLMFSATMPEGLAGIRDRFTRGAVKVKTETKVSEDMLKQFYCDVERQMKFSLLVHLLNEEDPYLSIVFCNTKREVDLVTKNLRRNGINADCLHGDMTQGRREHAIRDFHDGETDVLVATDVAARGLDFKKVTHIFNYGVPKNSEDYVNRIGRTARAGESGKAIVLLSEEDHPAFRRVMGTYDFEIQQMECNEFKKVPFIRGERDRQGRGGQYSRRGYGGRGGGRGRSYGYRESSNRLENSPLGGYGFPRSNGYMGNSRYGSN